MDNIEKWFDENSRKIMDFSDTNEMVISKEKFLEFAEMQASKISSNAVLAVSLPLEEMLNELPDNRPLYRDSGSWQIRSDDMEDVLYQQATNESLYDFIKRCYEKENKLMDLGQ